MPMEREYITTEADSLLALVKSRGELSIEEAAKTLNMPVKTVESYANFFEEEGLLTITYKFTTPYLSTKSSSQKVPEIEFSIEKKESKAADLLKIVGEQLDILKLKLKSGEYYLLKEKYPELLRNIKELLKSSKLPAEKASRLKSSMFQISSRLELASKNLEQKKMDSVRQNFVFLQAELSSVVDTIKSPDSARKEDTAETIHEEPAIETGDAKSTIQRINSLIEKGEFEKAQGLFEALQKAYQSMPEEYSQKEFRLRQNLEELQNSLSTGHVKLLTKDMDEKRAQITELIESSKGALAKGDISEATALFNEVKRIYAVIPKGFIRETIQLNNDILSLYKAISGASSADLGGKFDQTSAMIKASLNEIRKCLQAKEYNKAIQEYNVAVRVFNSLPNIRAPVRNNLKNYLLLIFEKLSSAKQQYFDTNLTKVLRSINMRISEAHTALDKQDLETAKQLYGHLLNGYNSIPKNYTEMLAPIQERLFEFYRRFSIELEKESQKEFDSAKANIEGLVLRVLGLMDNKKLEEALELFQRCMVLYNMLPEGFLKEKTQIKDRLIELQVQVEKGVDETLLVGLRPEMADCYHELLKHIALFYMNLESNDFTLASVNYRHIKRLLSQLSYGVITTSKLIKTELAEIATEVRVLGVLNQLSKAIKVNNTIEAKRAYDEVIALLKRLDSRKDQVMGLYRYLRNLVRVAHDKKSLKGVSPPLEQAIARKLSKEDLLRRLEDTMQKEPEGEIPNLQPLSESDEHALKSIATRGAGVARAEFDQLKGVLDQEMLNNIASQKQPLVVNNKIRMARLFLEFGNLVRAKALLNEAMGIDPTNKAIIALLDKMGEKI